MSNLLIYIEAGNGYTAETLKAALKDIRVCNIKIDATINLASGVATAKGDIVEITPKHEGDYYRALVVPQSVSNVDLISVVVDDETYILKQSVAFEANKQHKCKLVVSRSSSGINISIEGWDTDVNDNGGTVE